MTCAPLPRSRNLGFVSQLQLAALATAVVPGLTAVAVGKANLDTPDYHYCALVDAEKRHWMVQGARHRDASTALDHELTLLEGLRAQVTAGKLAFQVIQPEGVSELPNGMRAVVYRSLPGSPVRVSELTPGPGLTKSLGKAIAQIHELPHSVITAANAPTYDADTYRRRRLSEIDAAARTSKVPPILLARWERALEDLSMWDFQPTVVHGDLAPENVLFNHGTVSGVLHWQSAHVGDPAEDLAWLYAAAPEPSLDTLDEAYAMARSKSPDPHLGSRATLYSELAVARWLLHGVRLGDREVINDAAAMLQDLARQVEDSRPIGAPELEIIEDEEWVPAPEAANEAAEIEVVGDTEDWASDDTGEIEVEGDIEEWVGEFEESDAKQPKIEIVGDDPDATAEIDVTK